MVGDINIDILKENQLTTLYLDLLTTNGMESMINDFTREDLNKNNRSCIDHIFIRNKTIDTQLYSSIIKTNISDHYTLFLSYSPNKDFNFASKTYTQLTKICNFKVNNQIRTTNWHEIENETNPVEMFSVINEKFKNIYENSKTIISKRKNRVTSPWMTEYLIKSCETRDKLNKKWYHNKNNKQKENEYKKYRNFLNKKLNNAKNLYYKNKFYENRNDIRVTWLIINELIGKKVTNLDETITKNFKNLNITDICNNFAVNFKTNVEKIIHFC